MPSQRTGSFADRSSPAPRMFDSNMFTQQPQQVSRPSLEGFGSTPVGPYGNGGGYPVASGGPPPGYNPYPNGSPQTYNMGGGLLGGFGQQPQQPQIPGMNPNARMSMCG